MEDNYLILPEILQCNPNPLTKEYNGILGNSGYSLKEALRDIMRERPMVWSEGLPQSTLICYKIWEVPN